MYKQAQPGAQAGTAGQREQSVNPQTTPTLEPHAAVAAHCTQYNKPGALPHSTAGPLPAQWAPAHDCAHTLNTA
jgi:hypothetical protein